MLTLCVRVDLFYKIQDGGLGTQFAPTDNTSFGRHMVNRLSIEDCCSLQVRRSEDKRLCYDVLSLVITLKQGHALVFDIVGSFTV